MKFYTKAALAALASVAATSPAYAVDNYLFGFSPFGAQTLVLNGGAFTLQATDTGWYFQTGFHNPGNNNYIVGDCTSCGRSGSYNNYFVFDLSQITATITSAVLDVGNGNGYVAGVLSTYSLFDVSAPVSSLDVSRNDGDATGISIFNDFESGTLFGSRSITSVVQNSQVQTTLNSDAIAALNRARGGQWAIGGTLRPGNVVPGIPEPSTWGMLILGFGIVGASLRRRARLQMA
jgi:PEP-CTERM motif